MLKKFIILTLLVVISCGATLAYQLDKALNAPIAIDQDSFLTVNSGSSISFFAQQLEIKNGLMIAFG